MASYNHRISSSYSANSSFKLHGYVVRPFDFRLLWPLLTSHSSLLLRLMRPPVRPHGISRQSFLVYLPDLRLWVTIAFWTLLRLASLSAINALVSGFCSSGYDFAIPSSRLSVATQTLGVAMGFVGNYAPRGLSPQTDGMPVIPKKRHRFLAYGVSVEQQKRDTIDENGIPAL